MASRNRARRTPATRPRRADVLVNGALAVPGAPTDTSTVPAKFSKKNDADDHLLLLGYTFKGLSDEQRHAIYQSVKGKPDAAKATEANPQIGDALPGTLSVTALPPDVTGQLPDMQKFGYAMNGDQIAGDQSGKHGRGRRHRGAVIRRIRFRV